MNIHGKSIVLFVNKIFQAKHSRLLVFLASNGMILLIYIWSGRDTRTKKGLVTNYKDSSISSDEDIW